MKALIFSFTSLLLAGTLSAQTHWTDENCYDTSWYDASTSTYTIGNAAQLAGVACLVNEGTTFAGKTILLSADIDLNGMLWTPIGNGEETGQTNAEGLPQQAAFQGTLDGQGHTVSNMHIEASAKAGQEYTKLVYLGLVGLMSEDGKVANLNIGGDSHIKFEQIPFAESEEPDGYVSSSLLYVYAGGVCGTGNAYNCTNSSTLSIQGIEYADATVGGIVGDGEAQDCQNQGAIRATDLYEPDAGGIVGTGAASGCVNYGSVSLTARGNQGGIVGYGSAYGCTNHGTLSAYADDGYSIYMGGIIGKGTSVINCSNEGLLETDLKDGAAAHPQMKGYGDVYVLSGEIDFEAGVISAFLEQVVVACLVRVYALDVESDYPAEPELEVGSSVSSVTEGGIQSGVGLHVCPKAASLYSEGKFDELRFCRAACRSQSEYCYKKS